MWSRILYLSVLALICVSGSAKGANFHDVVISELMWMGDFSGRSHEWIELNNRTDEPIDLGGWELTRLSSGAEKRMLTILEGIIPPRGHFLISNNSAADSNLAVEPDLVDTAVSLANSQLQIKLYDGAFDGGGILISVADDGTGTPAGGDNENKKSMIRIEPPGDGTHSAQWITADISVGWDVGAKECGTPTSSGGSSPPPPDKPDESNALRGIVLFSELMWMGDFKSSFNEWFKLWNSTDQPMDLTNWTVTRLRDGEETLMLTIPEGVIPPLSYFLIANSSAEESNIAVEPDLVSADVSLPNSRLQLKLYDGPFDGNGILIDVADDGVGAPAAGDNDAKRSMVRHLDVLDGSLRSAWFTAVKRQGWNVGTQEFGTPDSEIALPVRLSTFSVESAVHGNALHWKTESEIDIIGWDIFRSHGQGGQYEKINGKIIRATGGVGAPQQYEYIDRIQNVDGRNLSYYIESISLNGERERSAIVAVTANPTSVSPRAKRILSWGKIKSRRD